MIGSAINIIKHSKKALKNALGALHDARVDSKGLHRSQKDSLKKAEARLREATKNANYGRPRPSQTAGSASIPAWYACVRHLFLL